MNPASGPPATGARCARHEDREATTTCERCGAFMCSECSEVGYQSRCLACRQREGDSEFPFDRSSWSFDKLFELTWDRWKPEWLMISVAMLIVMGVSWLLSAISQVVQVGLASIDPSAMIAGNVLFAVAQTLVQGVLQLGFVLICVDVLHGRTVDLSRLFSQFPKTLKLLGQYLVLFGIILVPIAIYGGLVAGVIYAAGGFEDEAVVAPIVIIAALIIFVPLVWVGIGLMFAQSELAYDDSVGVVESIRRSFRLVQDQRLAVFAFVFVAGIVAMLGLIACCVGVIATSGLSQVAITALYLSLRNGSGLPAPTRL